MSDTVLQEAGARGRTTAIAAAIGCVAIVGVGLSLSIPLLSIAMERMGASSTVIGLNTAAAGVASLLAPPFVPGLARRIGVVRLLRLAVCLSAACLAAFPLLPGLWPWFALRFVLSAALGALFVLSEYWISTAAPEDRRGLVMGIYATVLAAGFGVGPGLLALLGTAGPLPWLAGAGLILAGLLPLARAGDLSPRIGDRPGLRLSATLRLAPAATLAALVYGAVETGGFAILPLYGLRLGYGAEAAAGLVSALALGNVLFQIPVGWLADRWDRRTVLLLASLGGAAGAALLPAVAGSAWLLSALLLVWGGIAGTLYTVGLAHLGARVRGADLAEANAAFVMLYSAGLIVGPPLIGGGMDLASPHGFAAVLCALFAAYAAVLALTRGRARP